MKRRMAWLGIITIMPAFFAFFLPPVPNIESHIAGSVVISEVAWGGTAHSANDEWIELYNPTTASVDLAGWKVTGNSLDVTLSGVLPASGFYLLERTDDTTVSDIAGDQFYTGALLNGGETLTLRDAGDNLVDSANGNGGGWPAGSGSPGYYSMERTDPMATDSDANWNSNDGIAINGLDASGNPLNGTPRQLNSSWNSSPAPLLVPHKSAPPTAFPGASLVYSLSLTNNGNQSATGVVLTDSLPASFAFVADNSGLPRSQPAPTIIVWQVGDLPIGASINFGLTVTVPANGSGVVTNTLSVDAGNAASAATYANTTIIGQNAGNVLINGVFYDGFIANDLDEAAHLINIGNGMIDIGGWQLWGGASKTEMPATLILSPGQSVWLAKDGAAFNQTFGFLPDYEAVDTHPAIPDLIGGWLGLANAGDELVLRDASLNVIDAIVFENGNTAQNGWAGVAVEPYNPTSIVNRAQQLLARKRDQHTGQIIPDSNTAADWTTELSDPINGRKPIYPGWDLDIFFFPAQITETAYLTVAIAPDNAYEMIEAQIAAAQTSLQMEMHTFENLGVYEALLDALNRGVSVQILLEGSPPGGMDDQQKYICQGLEAAGGECWFMRSDDPTDIYNRYQYLHAKFILIDDGKVIISSENLSPNSLPTDDKSDGTFGRRGVVLATDAPGVVARVQSVFDHDFDLPATAVPPSTGHHDLFRWNAGTDAPSPGYTPITVTGGTTYTVRYENPLVIHGEMAFEVVQAPETSLRSVDSLLGLLNQAGNGDTILVQQLNEPAHWGGAVGTPATDPNLRLEAVIAAARRGARVRLLLDSFIALNDNNEESCDYLKSVAQAEGLDLQCALGNPTGLGIHNKMFLAEIAGKGYIHIGSINGSEQSNKGNRELALQAQSDEAYALLADMFERDYPHILYLPVVFNQFQGPAHYPLISELLYDPPGIDDAEFIEIVNPTHQTIDLSGYGIGDAVFTTDFEEMLRFPAGTVLPPQGTLLLTTNAAAFFASYGFMPDYEMYESDPTIPNMIDDPNWGDPAARLALGNSGDELLLIAPDNAIVDAVVYGSGALPGNVPCPLVLGFNVSLERAPYWRDTDDCSADFREQFPPRPGELP